MNQTDDKTERILTSPSFLSLLETHGELNELFLSHQEALLTLDVELALERLELFELKLLAHMRPEEDVLLPVYGRAGRIPGGPIDLFTGEHRKMLEFLGRFKGALRELLIRPPDLKRRVIKLFDEQAMFKHLVEHHDLRERNILYPTLDQVTSQEERRKLLEQFLAQARGIQNGSFVERRKKCQGP